jgi:hypothetical protein
MTYNAGMGKGKKRVTIPISTARRQLFQLTDLVRKSGDDTVVVLEQRGGHEPVALVREARLAYLEAREEELDKAEKIPFKLAGSLKTHLDEDAIEQLFRELRKGWTRQSTIQPPSQRGRKPARARK